MDFDTLDARLRALETADDSTLPPGRHVVARVDGRGFTRLTREVHAFDAPFDPRFKDLMVATAAHLMECGFRALLAYTQSDEISLLLHPDDDTFGRKTRKWLSVLAGEASAAFSARLGAPAAFDSRCAVLPDRRSVLDVFRWRQADALRNALNAHAYWALRKSGIGADDASRRLAGLPVDAKKALVRDLTGTAFTDTPVWQRHGIPLHPEAVAVAGTDPRTGAATWTTRRRLRTVDDLPFGDAYERFLEGLLE